MARPQMFLVDSSGQPLPTHIERAVMGWLARVRAAFPSLEDATVVDVLEGAALRIVRREAQAGPIEHLRAYAWVAIRSVAISRLRLGAERLRSLTTEALPDGATVPFGATVGAAHVETGVLLRQLLRQLSVLERRVFLLKLAGYSTREIALRVKRAPTTVDSLHSRSLARLRACARRGGRTDHRVSS